MKRLFAFLALATIGTLLPSTTHAQYQSFITRDAGPYWWVDAGATIPQDGHVTEIGPWGSGQKLTYDVGFGADVGFGYGFNKYLATELQLGGTWNDIDSIEGASLHDTFFGTMPILANLVLQYPIPRTRVVPFIGAGVGGAATFFDTDSYHQHLADGTSVTLHGSDSDFVFAWQGFAGLRLNLDNNMAVGLTYRFLYADASTFSFDSYYHGGPSLDLGFSAFETHLVALTFTMKF
jgi:opacity protein-like surface antigen